MTGTRQTTLDTVETLDLYGGWETVRTFANDTNVAYTTMAKRVHRMAKRGLVELRINDDRLEVRPNPNWGRQ